MITTICSGDWIQFQQIERGRLITVQGRVKADPKFPDWLWVGDRIVADSDGEQSGDIIVLAHVSDDATDRIARAAVIAVTLVAIVVVSIALMLRGVDGDA